jgi:hypothetical protein
VLGLGLLVLLGILDYARNISAAIDRSVECKSKKGIEIKAENDLIYSAIAVLFKEGKQSRGRRQGRRARLCAPLEPARGGG